MNCQKKSNLLQINGAIFFPVNINKIRVYMYVRVYVVRIHEEKEVQKTLLKIFTRQSSREKFYNDQFS